MYAQGHTQHRLCLVYQCFLKEPRRLHSQEGMRGEEYHSMFVAVGSLPPWHWLCLAAPWLPCCWWWWFSACGIASVCNFLSSRPLD